MNHVDPQQWLERCRAGEAEAVEWLVRTHQAAVYRLALSILDDPDEADEATQETFLAALRRLATFRGQAAFTTWLYAIAVNVSRSRWRKGRTRQRLRAVLQAAGWTARPDPLPEAAAVQRETAGAVWQAVEQLGEKHRLPVILRYYHDLPTAEIAQVLGISEGTVHSRLATARDRLRLALRAVHAEPAQPVEAESRGQPSRTARPARPPNRPPTAAWTPRPGPPSTPTCAAAPPAAPMPPSWPPWSTPCVAPWQIAGAPPRRAAPLRIWHGA